MTPRTSHHLRRSVRWESPSPPDSSDEPLIYLRELDRRAAGREAIFAQLWACATVVACVVALLLPSVDLMSLVSVVLALAGPFVVALLFALKAAPIVRRTCERSWREQLLLAGLSPHGCLEARLQHRPSGLRENILVAGVAWVLTGLVAPPAALIAGMLERGASWILIFALAGCSLFAVAIWGGLLLAMGVARSAVDEMILRAPTSVGESAIGLGELILHGMVALFLRTGIGAGALVALAIAFNELHRIVVSGYWERPEHFAFRRALIWAAPGVIVLWLLARSMRVRRELARIRMDAPE